MLFLEDPERQGEKAKEGGMQVLSPGILKEQTGVRNRAGSTSSSEPRPLTHIFIPGDHRPEQAAVHSDPRVCVFVWYLNRYAMHLVINIVSA